MAPRGDYRLVAEFVRTGGKGDVNFVLPVGIAATSDPLGPDTYGYYALDDSDVAYEGAPVFDWIEIDPTHGGTGTDLGLSDFGWEQDDIEFVTLPFIHTNAPVYLAGIARPGPTMRDNRAVTAMARLLLHPHIPNSQTSWVKLGTDGAAEMLRSGANDLGGVLMNESITRAAGATHGQEISAADLERMIRQQGRTPQQRTTLYAPVDAHTRRDQPGLRPFPTRNAIGSAKPLGVA